MCLSIVLMTDTQKSLILICFFSFHFSLPKGGLALGRQEVHAVAEQRKHEIARFLKSLFSSQLGIIHILRLHIFGTFLAHPTQYVSMNTVQVFRGFDFRDFRFTAVYNSIIFSSPLLLLSNLDLRGFCFHVFFSVSPTLTV